jgi:hypothetical protein
MSWAEAFRDVGLAIAAAIATIFYFKFLKDSL